MTSTLRQVLQAFEEANTSLRFDQLSRDLGVDPGTLDNMIQHWVRKGRIREVPGTVDEDGCRSCGSKGKCPFIVRMPRTYELVPGDAAEARRSRILVSCCSDGYR